MRLSRLALFCLLQSSCARRLPFLVAAELLPVLYLRSLPKLLSQWHETC